MAPPESISRRKGTTNHGSIYEQRIATLLAVRCVLNEDVEDMWIGTNIEGLGAFDDVVLFVQKKKGNCSYKELYLTQIRYKNNGNINLGEGKNNLLEYQKDFLKVKDDFLNGSSPLTSCCKFDDIKFLLFTNTQINTSNNQTHNCSSDDFLNTGEIFQISQETSAIYDFHFLKQTYFYYNQVDVSKVTKLIKQETDKYFTNCNVEAIINLFDNWYAEQLENKIALAKENIQSLILETVLSNYIPEPTTDEFIKANIWNEVANQFKFLFIKHEDYLAKIWQGVKLQLCTFFDDQNVDLLNWDKPLIQASDKINRIKQCPLNVHLIIKRDKNSYSLKDLYLLLWQICELPIILNLSTNSQKDIHAALSKMDSSHSSGRRYIFLRDASSDLHHRYPQFNFSDIDKDTTEIFLKNACVSLQGKEAVTLKELKLSVETLEKITPDILIHLLQPITRNVDFDSGYLPRFVLQPTVIANVLTIPNVVFVIVLGDNIHYSYIRSFGIALSLSEYRQINFINEIVPETWNLKLVNIITLTNIVSFEEYKNIENVIREVRKCEEQTIHYLEFLGENKLKWLHSNRDAYQIKPFLISNSASGLPDSELFPYLTFNILSGIAGEGKSTLLHFAANNSPSNVWVIELKIREISEYIDTLECFDIISFLFDQSNEKNERFKEFSRALFQSLYDDRKILLVIDGIDEVRYNSHIENFLIAVKSLGIKTLIATRPSLNNILEEKIRVPFFSLKALTNEDCLSLIKLKLQNNDKISETNMNTILRKVYLWSNVVGTPLLLKLFVSLLNDQILQDTSEFDISDLFDNYINIQLREVGSYNALTINTLTRSALFVLYEEDVISQLSDIKYSEHLEHVENRIQSFINSKIIEKINKNRTLIFAHKSLAEFLVAKYLFRLAESSNVPNDFLKSMFYKELETVRLFFDMLALKGSGFQDVIMGNNPTDHSNIINTEFVDKFGRNILHIAASYGKRCELRSIQSLWSGVNIYESYNNVQNNIIAPCHKFVRRTVVSINFVCQLLQRNLDPHKKDNLFKMDVFGFAIESGSLEIIEALFSRKCIKELRDINNDVILFNVVREGFINIFRELRNKNYNLKISPAMDNLLHISLFSEKLEIIKELSNNMKLINEPNYSGYTPLISWLTLLKLYSKQHSIPMDLCTISSLNENQLAILNYLIDKKINLNAVNDRGETLLHAFCGSQETAVIEKLIKNGAEVNRKTLLGDTPLHYASRYSMQNVELLVKKYKSAIDIPNNIGYTPLYDAAQNNKIDILKYLIEQGADGNRNKDVLSPLAALKSSVKRAQLLLMKRAKINQTQINKTLAFAVLSGDLNCIRLLLDHGAIVNKSLFHLAVALNRKQIIEFFLPQGLIDTTNENMNGLLIHSILNNDTDLTDILIKYGADVNAKNGSNEETPLHLACKLGLKKMIVHLITNKSAVNVKTRLGETPLSLAATLENVEILEILINKGSDLQKYGPDALRAAITSDNSDVFDYLISAGVDINRFDSTGHAPIHIASQINLYWVRKIKRMGADVNLKLVNDGVTPLMIAAYTGRQDIIEYLLKNGANINEEALNRHTALSTASQEGHLECLKFLVDKGSDVQKYGTRAISVAAMKGHFTVLDYLISAGADINGRIVNRSPVHEAVLGNNVELIGYLLNKGANVNIKTILEGHTPLMFASLNGCRDIIEYLIENGANVNEEAHNQYTALAMASQEGHLECVKFLINKGSDVQKYGPRAICSAAIKGHFTVIDYLISSGVDVNKTVDNDISPIHDAALADNIKFIKYLLSKGANINIKTALEGCTALMYASLNGSRDLVEYLTKNGARINEEASNHDTALTMACRKGHLECIKFLISKRRDVRKYGSLAISVAASGNHINVVDYLVSAGADINGTVANDNFPIHIAVLEGNIKAIEYLLSKGANVNIKTVLEGFTPLMFASLNGRQDIVEYLIENGANINEEGRDQFSALSMASKKGHLECVKFLIRKGSDVRKYGSLALSLAAIGNHINVVDYLVSAGADIHGTVDDDRFPIHVAVVEGNIKAIEYLLSKGANVNIKTVLEGFTPLMFASLNGRRDIVEYLIENGAKVNEENSNGDTALTMACMRRHLECVKLLIDKSSEAHNYICIAAVQDQTTVIDYLVSAGADINGTSDSGRSPIHYAVSQGNIKATEYLLSKGANVNIKTVLEGYTPLMIASLKGRQNIVEYLIKNGAKVNEECSMNQDTALIMACQQGHLECVKFLIDRGSDLQKYGPSALYTAAAHDHITTIDYLISAGADSTIPLCNAVLQANLKVMKYLLERGAVLNI